MLLTRRILLNRPSWSSTIRTDMSAPPPNIDGSCAGGGGIARDGPVNELPRRPSPLSPAVPRLLPLRAPLFVMLSGVM